MNSSDSIEIMLYYNIYELFQDPLNKAKYEEVANLFEARKETLDPKTFQEICEYLMNFCIRYINMGDYLYSKKLLSLYIAFK